MSPIPFGLMRLGILSSIINTQANFYYTLFIFIHVNRQVLHMTRIAYIIYYMPYTLSYIPLMIYHVLYIRCYILSITYYICSKMDYMHRSICHTSYTEYMYTICTICNVLRLLYCMCYPMQVYDTMICIGITLCRSGIRYYLSLHVTVA